MSRKRPAKRARAVMGNDDFVRYLEDHHKLYVVETVGDGNCLYYSLAMAFLNDQNRQMEVRQKVAQQIRDNPLDYFEFADEEVDYEAMIYETTVNHNYSYEFQLAAASEAYGYNIIVYSPDGAITSYPHDRRHPRSIQISFHNGNHYNLLLEIVQSVAVESRSNEIVLDVSQGEQLDFPIQTSGLEDEVLFDHNKEQLPNEAMENDGENENVSEDEYDVDMEDDGENEGDSGDESDEDIEIDDESIEDESDGDATDKDVDGEDENINHSILKKKGFNFLASKLFKCGRNTVYHFFLIPKFYAKTTLVESIRNVKGRVPMFHYVSYSTRMFQLFTRDKDVHKLFHIWISRKGFPLEETKSNMRMWYSSFMVVYVLLTAINHTWMGETFKFLFLRCKRNLVSQLLTEVWQNCKEDVQTSMDLLNEHGENLICEQCNPGCLLRKHEWHINLADYKLIDIPATGYNCAISKTNNFRERSLPRRTCDIILKLREFYLSSDSLSISDKMLSVYSILDNNTSTPTTFYSYLLLLLDGEEMTNETTLEDAMNDEKFFISLYSGQSKDVEYRHSHFFNNSGPIFKLLSSTSRVFLIRSESFCFRDLCRRDEALTNEILKLTLETAKQNGRRQPFVLLNKNSENANLINSDEATIEYVLDFCRKEVPVFVPDSFSSPRIAVEGPFKGYYKVIKEIAYKDHSIPFCRKLYDKFIYP